MKIEETIEGLRRERDAVIASIAALERLSLASSGLVAAKRSSRGRKSMGAAERQDVSERMRKYWAGRREGRTA
jgi:hypothetical protein